MDKFRFVDSYRSEFSVDLLCRTLKISRSGYYAWISRGVPKRILNEHRLLVKLIELHEKYPASGLDSLLHMLKANGLPCSRNRLHRLMKKYNIHSARKRVYKVTANSNHNYAVSPNLLKRNFTACEPNPKWVGVLLTYIVTDLCTKKIVVYAFGDRITLRPVTETPWPKSALLKVCHGKRIHTTTLLLRTSSAVSSVNWFI